MYTSSFTRPFVVTPEYCGMTSKLSAQAVFTMFQAIASQHAELIGVGGDAMAARGEFWLTVHSRVDFFGSARLMDELTAETWPERCAAREVRCYRSYSLRRGDELIALGRTQWAVMGEEGRLMRFGQTGFPEDFPYLDRVGIADAPARFTDDFAPGELLHSYIVRPTDIDMGHHMNNVAYVRALLDCFSAAELAEGRISSMEVHYSAQCREGEALGVYMRREGELVRMAIKKADGRPAVLAAVKFK